jgi:hypothetical protein
MPENVQTDSGPTLTSLVSGILDDAQRLIRQEFTLAKTEVKEEVNKAKSAAASFGEAAAVAALAVILLSFMVVYLLNWLTGLELWGCYGIVGAVYLLVALILFYTGKNKAEQIHVVPPQTAETMRENVQWIRNQT